ncbi:cyclic nucleotide-binding domain-containing protein [Cellulosilyticum sp. I15G10I2]|uniref:cyclic nucleotide-binding domain-containing protein n=1 Tax=Cellulosilyticum sp. I15G10I2 TaxID=1892843 RepID=UPI00085C7A72|nr:cyclic nucleotide-binding domain-containing protein [Cellulosilyticum sp. I15G10I2]
MIKINDSEKLNHYVAKYDIDKLFDEDAKTFIELLFFKKNEYICRQDEPIHYLFFFVEGKAKIFTTQGNGKSLLLSFYQEFKVLGDLEIINFEVATANVQAIEDTYCLGIPVEQVRTYLFNNVKLLRFICQSLGEKLNRCTKNSSVNLLYPLENRLASYMLATAPKEELNGENIIKLNENLTEVSELLGTSYRHLLRTLDNLCSKNIIKKKGHGFEVLDERALKKLAENVYK